MVADTHTATAGTHYWSDPNAWTHTEAGHIPTDGDAVAIPTGCIIYFDAAHDAAHDNFTTGINGIVVTSTGELHFALNGTDVKDTALVTAVAYPNNAGAGGIPYLTMKDATNISGTGALYIGDSTSAPIPRPTAAATYAPNATILLGATTSQITNTGGQYYYGWIPTTPAAHPAYTTIVGSDVGDDTPPLATETKMRVADSNFDVRQGEIILVGVGGTAGVMAEANKGVYTCNAAPASSVITISTGGGLVTNRTLGDCIAVYSRPILITKAVYSATANTVPSIIMQGVRINNIYWTTGYSCTFNGVTFTPNGNTGLLTLATYNTTYTDCVGNNSGTNYPLLSNGGSNETFTGCVVINSVFGLTAAQIDANFINCFAQNNTNGLTKNAAATSVASGCVIRACGVGTGQYNSLKLINCSFANNTADVDFPFEVPMYNTTLSTVTNYMSLKRPTWVTLQSRKHAGTIGYRAFWGRGGYGTTNQATAVYGSTYSTMQFVIETANTPLIWDTQFWLPANKSLTFNVPMGRLVGDTGITAEVWVYEPHNDPLFSDPLWTLTPSVGTTQGSPTATFVVARTAMPDVAVTPIQWQNVSVTMPAATTARPLVARVIVKGSSTSKNCYAYLDSIEAALMKKRMVYI